MKNLKLLRVNILILLFFVSCNFTPRIHREILEAQDIVAKQNYSEAIKKYEKILELNPRDTIKVKIHFQLGELYHIYFSDYKKAIISFSKIQNLTPNPKFQIKAKEKIADIYFSFLGKYEVPISIYKKLLQFRPKLIKNSFYKFRLGVSYLNLNKYEESQQCFNELINSNEKKYASKSLFYLGQLNYQQEKWSDSIIFWKKYIRVETKPNQIIKTKFLIGNAYESIENLKEAYNYYYSVLGLFPNTEVVLNRLNSVYERRVARKR